MSSGDFRDIKIDLRQLGNIVLIADCQSISAAAFQSGISQPALSESVGRLEKELGFPLLIRTARGIEFTQAGAALAKFGRKLIETVESELRIIERLGREESGRVSIALPPTYAGIVGVPLIETIRLEHPGIQLSINEAISPVIGEGVLSGEFDFGVTYQGLNFKPFMVRALMEEELFLFAASDNWEGEVDAAGFAVDPIRFKELAKLPLVVPKRPNGLRNLLDRHAKSIKTELNVAFEIDSLRNMIALVTRASGFTILTHATVTGETVRQGLTLVPIIEPQVAHTSYLIRKRGLPVSPASQVVERSLTNILSEQINRFGLRATLLKAQVM